LNQTQDIGHLGGLNYTVYISYIIAMVCCYGCVANGVKTSGKIAIYTGTLPYVILTVLIMRGVFLDGSFNGLYYLIKPDFNKILDM